MSLVDAYHGFTSALGSGQLDKLAEFVDPDDPRKASPETMKAILRYPVTDKIAVRK